MTSKRSFVAICTPYTLCIQLLRNQKVLPHALTNPNISIVDWLIDWCNRICSFILLILVCSSNIFYWGHAVTIKLPVKLCEQLCESSVTCFLGWCSDRKSSRLFNYLLPPLFVILNYITFTWNPCSIKCNTIILPFLWNLHSLMDHTRSH